MGIKDDYKLTFEAYKDAQKSGNYKLMSRLSDDLERLANLIENG